ncbi:NERD domain-containing protein [Fictibacillus nanhaiensis]|uniref:nuclease-related domain-containing protein n=1 Tax=Fictibacillus nanhaiensis TaxID=742169 RepID=UPI001C986402|nr:nuclease-related domain-containing protein [Fictibacillus nanhaiensis]MBY6037131.1 NERD domain-containing protein [Fictibacillus nanhaiensis]
MIVKEATESIKIVRLKEILKRISPTHLKRNELEGELARSHAGFRGEQSLFYHLDLLPHDDCFIFHDLRIPHKSSFFQLDILILTPTFFLIIEVKNMAGTLIFDQEFNQLHRILNGIEETFADPVSQIYRQTFLFKEWLNNQRLPKIPIESLIIISNPHTRIKSIPDKTNLSKMVTHSSNLLPRFHRFLHMHNKEIMTKKEIKKLSRLLLKQHTQNSSDLFEQFSISENNLIKGVPCPNCESIPMIRKKRQWFCEKCFLFSKDAHVEALKTYRILFGPRITNSQCRDFLKLSSRHTTKHLLRSLHLPESGLGKYKNYELLNF